MSTSIRKKKIAAERSHLKNKIIENFVKKIQNENQNGDEIIQAFKIRGINEHRLVIKKNDVKTIKNKIKNNERKITENYFVVVEKAFKAEHLDTKTAVATVNRKPSEEELAFYSSVFMKKN